MTKQSFAEQIPTYASLITAGAFFVATWGLHRMRHHGLVVGFLGVQLAFGVVMLAALIAGVKTDSKAYLWLFFWSLVGPAIISWPLAMKWAFELPASRPMWLALLITAVICVCLPVYLHDLAPNSGAYLFYASVFAFPGILSLLTTAGALNRAETMVHLGLSLFWLMLGAYAFTLAAGRSNVNLQWLEAAWVPSAIAIVCFGVAAWRISRGQFEGSRETFHMALQHVHDAAVSVRSMVR